MTALSRRLVLEPLQPLFEPPIAHPAAMDLACKGRKFITHELELAFDNIPPAQEHAHIVPYGAQLIPDAAQLEPGPLLVFEDQIKTGFGHASYSARFANIARISLSREEMAWI